jgi:hypothetical protein
MRYELELVRASITPAAPGEAVNQTRKALREVTDGLIHNALLLNDLPELVRMSAETMVCVATALARYEQNPEVPDFVEATKTLIEGGRGVMDRGLMLGDWPTANCGAVMLEIAVRGICAALSIPYDKVLAEVHRAQQAGENANVRAILVEAGLLKPPPVERTCAMCGYVGTETDHIGQCPVCHWDELQPPPTEPTGAAT